MFLSERSTHAENPIEEMDRIAERLEAKGKSIYRLNRGDPAKYFPTPKYIIKAYHRALDEGVTYYTMADGTRQLKDAISKRYRSMYGLKTDRRDITVTAGLSEAIMFLNSALIDPSDHAILFKPFYPIYTAHLRMCGGDEVMESYDERNRWNIDIDGLSRSLRALRARNRTKRIKYMMITNPNNPTGTVLERSVLKEVVELANEYGIMLISDEIYDEIIYNRARFTSISEIAKGVPYVILNGASKDYDSTGFRIGFAIIPGTDRKSEMLKDKMYQYAQMRLSVNSPAESAVAEAISNTSEHRKAIKSMVKQIEERANHATKLLNENPEFQTVEPNGAFYILPRIDMKAMGFKNDKEFVQQLLLEKCVQVTRGSGFGAQSHFRIVALPPKGILDDAINRINEFCKAHSR